MLGVSDPVGESGPDLFGVSDPGALVYGTRLSQELEGSSLQSTSAQLSVLFDHDGLLYDHTSVHALKGFSSHRTT